MKFIFRTDASNNIGSGHVMRCLAIAEEAIYRGIECQLFGDLNGIDWLEKRISEIGWQYQGSIFPSDYLISRENVLIIDSYGLNPTDPVLSSKNWGAKVTIADRETPQFVSDLIFHPGLSDTWFKGDKTSFFFGFGYLPIRNSIVKNKSVNEQARFKIVVFGGGTDTFGFSNRIADELKHIPNFDEAVFFSNDKKGIEKIDHRFRVSDFGSNLDHELSETALVFTTASTSSLEIVAREIPLGVGCAVGNQMTHYNSLRELTLAACVGEKLANDEWKINSELVKKLITNSEYRSEIKDAQSGLIDLRGSRRIVEKIVETFRSKKSQN